MELASELAHALDKAVKLEQAGHCYECTPEFTKLMHTCGEELIDIGEYVLDASEKLNEAHLLNKDVNNLMEASGQSESEVVEETEHNCQVEHNSEVDAEDVTSNSIQDPNPVNNKSTSEEFRTSPGRQSEMSSTTGQVYLCIMCSATFESKHKQQSHINKHSNDPFKCKKCGKIFFTQDSLNSHVCYWPCLQLI